MTTKITLYFDIESPFSHFAYELLLRHEKAWKVELILKPVMLGGIFRATGNAPPGMVPVKGQYMFKDLRRKCAMHGILWRGMPSNSRASKHAEEPYFVSAPGNRLFTAALQRYGCKNERCRRLISRLYHLVMVEHAGKPFILSAEVLESACRASGFTHSEATDLVVGISTTEIKAAVKAATDEAAHEGAFGVPYMCLDGPGIARSHRVWFGADALPTIAHVLGKQFVVPAISKM